MDNGSHPCHTPEQSGLGRAVEAVMRITLFLVSVTLAVAQTKLPPSANSKIDFEKDVQPILAQKCHSCHGKKPSNPACGWDKRQNALRAATMAR